MFKLDSNNRPVVVAGVPPDYFSATGGGIRVLISIPLSSFDDIFMKRRFSSYIYKESNIYNRNLLEYNTTAEDVRRDQQKVKTLLSNFENDLWEY